MHEADIALHHIIDALALNLDYDVFPRNQLCAVHLGDRGRSQALLLNTLKYLIP